jgi:SOS-response transcriptional repressor LexA
LSRRDAILQTIREFAREHGCWPTEREIADILGISKTTVHYHITMIWESGELRKMTWGRPVAGCGEVLRETPNSGNYDAKLPVWDKSILALWASQLTDNLTGPRLSMA